MGARIALRQLLKKIPGKNFIFDIAVKASEHSKPRYQEAPLSALASISPRPMSTNCAMGPIAIDPGIDLSIVVPMHNVESYIAECVDSILGQRTSYRFEVILVNDGSSDSTRECAFAASRRDGRVRIVDQPNAGVAAARNKGLDVCRGAAVTFVDSDDFLKQGFIQSCMDSLMASGVDYVTSGYSDADERGRVFGSCTVRKGMGTPWGRVFRREVWGDVRFPDGFLFEDTVLPYLIAPRYRSGIVENDFYCYRHRNSSISRSGKNTRAIDTFWVVEYLLERCGLLGVPFGAVANEFLTNACFTVYGRRLQLDGKWLLPLFSAFSDVWADKGGSVSTEGLPGDLRQVAQALSMRKFDQWRFLGWREVMRNL